MRQQQVSVRATSAAVAFVAVLLALLGANCGGSGGNPDGGDNADVTTNPCGASNLKLCGSSCVDIQGDYQNCGGCGTVCTNNEVCSHGACAVVCGGGSSRCGNNCVDLNSDPQNCGGCNNQCTGGQVCDARMCTLTCQQGLTNCNSACVDTTSDDFNCGKCGNGCPDGQQCVNSACQATCQTGYSTCPAGDGGTTCVDTQLDPNHCGSCTTPCSPGYFCSGGNCGLNCAGGTSLCGTACVDENIDPNHCGGCSTVCPGGDDCSAGHCCGSATPYYCGGCDTFAHCVQKSGGHIAAGVEHTCAINMSGAVYCWGYNYYGALGNGGNTTSNSAVATSTLTSGTASIAADEYGNCAITTSGAAYCWGYGYEGQLGNNTSTYAYAPAAVCANSTCTSNITTTAARSAGGGIYANCFLMTNGSVECTGADYEGQIGLGSVTSTIYTTPQATKVTANATTISGTSVGYLQCAAVSGSLECWGYQPYSVGDGTTTNSGAPITVKNVTNPLAADSSYYHTCVVETGGTLKCWGYNYYGELGDGTTTDAYTAVTATLSNVIAVSTGYYHTCAITAGGAVYCIGYNYYGQLGNGTTSTVATTTWQQAIASGAVGITSGEEHSCALMANGHAECWGWNGSGQLGDGTNVNRSTAVLVSGF